MRPYAALIALVILCVTPTPAFAQQPPEEPQQQPTPVVPGVRLIAPGRALAGIELGSRIQRVLTRFGRPADLRETAVDTVYVYSRYGIAVYARGGVVSAVSTSNSLLKINEDVGVGYRIEDVTTAFGRGFRESSVEGFPGVIYDEQGIAFGLDGRGVAVVVVFRPGTATSVSAFLPGAALVVPGAGFPNVANLRPFSAAANFTSLPGYLRRLVHEISVIWITYGEAARVVSEQKAAAR